MKGKVTGRPERGKPRQTEFLNSVLRLQAEGNSSIHLDAAFGLW